MSVEDIAILALTCWRENRGGGYVGMQSVANVVVNRKNARNSSLYTECIRPWQFSSMTAKCDPQLATWPADSDPQWIQALNIAQQASEGTLPDITLGATSYYAASMDTPPDWAAQMQFTVTIEGQKFYKA